MSAKHALLGLLLDRPAYPYQLASRLEQRLGPSWEVNSGQLYQTVKALQRDGLIERVQGAGGGREDRHVFAITDQGVREFERWFEHSPDPVRLPKRPLLAKITFAGPERLAEAIEKIEAYERECAARLSHAARLRDELPTDTPRDTPSWAHHEGHTPTGIGKHAGGPLVRAEQLLLRLNLSTDVVQLEGELRWAAHARELLAWLAEGEAVWPSSDRQARSGERECSQARKELFERMARSAPGPVPATGAPPAPDALRAPKRAGGEDGARD